MVDAGHPVLVQHQVVVAQARGPLVRVVTLARLTVAAVLGQGYDHLAVALYAWGGWRERGEIERNKRRGEHQIVLRQ